MLLKSTSFLHDPAGAARVRFVLGVIFTFIYASGWCHRHYGCAAHRHALRVGVRSANPSRVSIHQTNVVTLAGASSNAMENILARFRTPFWETERFTKVPENVIAYRRQ